VQIPPSRCRSDSVSPRPATGPQRSEAGINGGPWQPHAGYPVSQASMGSASKGVLSHRERYPAQEADALEPKRHRIGRRQPSILTGVHCHRNPVESTALRMRAMETGNGVTPYGLSETCWMTGAGANRMAYREGFLKKQRPGVMPRIS
jgi:hypothetical protein